MVHCHNFTIADNVPSDNRGKIDIVEAALQDIPCNHIVGLVIYNLPGRDCAAKASNGELMVGELPVYKTEYIDRKIMPSECSLCPD